MSLFYLDENFFSTHLGLRFQLDTQIVDIIDDD